MGRLETVERRIWQITTGSSNSHYRQALWRPTRQGTDGLAMSETFPGDSEASKWNRRQWSRIGVVAFGYGSLERVVGQPNLDPAVAFTIGSMLVVGKLEDLTDIGYTHAQGSTLRAHGLRIGPDDTRFAVGGITEDGQFVTPDSEEVITMPLIPISALDVDDQRFANVNFS